MASEKLPDNENRDPNEINPYVKVDFGDIIAEPDSIHSADCVWQWSYKCFTGAKNCCYLFLTYICAIPLSCCWGLVFACLAFSHIWKFTPCLRCYLMNLSCCQKYYGAYISCIYTPICEAFSLIFSKLKING